MCQQTRVEAVIPYWLAWMQAFPTVEALAAASEDEVNARWAGLGFYRRAKMLHEGSQQVVNELNGEVPTTVDGLMKLRGVGRYTAVVRSWRTRTTTVVHSGSLQLRGCNCGERSERFTLTECRLLLQPNVLSQQNPHFQNGRPLAYHSYN